MTNILHDDFRCDSPRPLMFPGNEIVVGELTGWRAWEVDTLHVPILKSMVISTPWIVEPRFGWQWYPGPKIPMRTKEIAGEACQEETRWGLHCFKEEQDLYNYMDVMWGPYGYQGHWIFGTVQLWGEVVEHELGYRSTHQKIMTLNRYRPHVDAKPIPNLLEDCRRWYGLSE